MTPPVNELHAVLRLLSLDDAIALVAAQIPKRGADVVKQDPGIYEWARENRVELSKRANTGGLR